MDGILPVLIALGSFVLGFAVAIVTRKHKEANNASEKSEKIGDITHDSVTTETEEESARHERSRQLMEKASISLLEILRQLALAVKNLDGATSRSTTRLTNVRSKLDKLPELPNGLGEYQSMIIQEVDKIMQDNSELRSELSKSQQELAKQKKVIDFLQHEVHTDRLTHVANRLSFEEYSDQCFTRFAATRKPFCLLLADVDHFKKINDTHGHIIGDRVLEAMANKLHICLRSTDYIARYGGEEFVIILEDMQLRAACKVADDLRNSIETTVFDVEGKKLRLTVSIGCAEVMGKDDRSSLVKRADEEMYNAKNAGRNRVYPRLIDN